MHNLGLMHEARGDLDRARDTMGEVLRLRLKVRFPKFFLQCLNEFDEVWEFFLSSRASNNELLQFNKV